MSVGTKIRPKSDTAQRSTLRVGLIVGRYRFDLMASSKILDQRVLGYRPVFRSNDADVLQDLANRFHDQAVRSDVELTPLQKRMQSGSF